MGYKRHKMLQSWEKYPYRACETNRVELVRRLLEKVADPNRGYPLREACLPVIILKSQIYYWIMAPLIKKSMNTSASASSHLCLQNW